MLAKRPPLALFQVQTFGGTYSSVIFWLPELLILVQILD
jgi:hypothetical protein